MNFLEKIKYFSNLKLNSQILEILNNCSHEQKMLVFKYCLENSDEFLFFIIKDSLNYYLYFNEIIAMLEDYKFLESKVIAPIILCESSKYDLEYFYFKISNDENKIINLTENIKHRKQLFKNIYKIFIYEGRVEMMERFKSSIYNIKKKILKSEIKIVDPTTKNSDDIDNMLNKFYRIKKIIIKSEPQKVLKFLKENCLFDEIYEIQFEIDVDDEIYSYFEHYKKHIRLTFLKKVNRIELKKLIIRNPNIEITTKFKIYFGFMELYRENDYKLNEFLKNNIKLNNKFTYLFFNQEIDEISNFMKSFQNFYNDGEIVAYYIFKYKLYKIMFFYVENGLICSKELNKYFNHDSTFIDIFTRENIEILRNMNVDKFFGNISLNNYSNKSFNFINKLSLNVDVGKNKEILECILKKEKIKIENNKNLKIYKNDQKGIFEKLEYEINVIFHIFSFIGDFNKKEFFYSFSRVSKKWKEFVQNYYNLIMDSKLIRIYDKCIKKPNNSQISDFKKKCLFFQIWYNEILEKKLKKKYYYRIDDLLDKKDKDNFEVEKYFDYNYLNFNHDNIFYYAFDEQIPLFQSNELLKNSNYIFHKNYVNFTYDPFLKKRYDKIKSISNKKIFNQNIKQLIQHAIITSSIETFVYLKEHKVNVFHNNYNLFKTIKIFKRYDFMWEIFHLFKDTKNFINLLKKQLSFKNCFEFSFQVFFYIIIHLNNIKLERHIPSSDDVLEILNSKDLKFQEDLSNVDTIKKVLEFIKTYHYYNFVEIEIKKFYNNNFEIFKRDLYILLDKVFELNHTNDQNEIKEKEIVEPSNKKQKL